MSRFAVAALLAASLLGGCNSTTVMPPTVNVSIGQQLIDLKKARDTGALSEKEYQRQREDLIDSVR
ncbi:MAG: hypothetical protein ACREBN_07860 [Burkholderiaceae bacterium]